MKEDEDYVPYGPQWEKEIMKMSKVHIINMLRKALTTNDEAWAEGYNTATKEAVNEIAKNYHPNA